MVCGNGPSHCLKICVEECLNDCDADLHPVLGVEVVRPGPFHLDLVVGVDLERGHGHGSAGTRVDAGLKPGQYTSIAFSEALQEAGITGSIGSVGDALDNALMESTIGLYKTEVIDRHDRHDRSWTSWRDVEAATASWVHWFNHDRLHTSIDDVPQAKYEHSHHHRTHESANGYDHTAVA